MFTPDLVGINLGEITCGAMVDTRINMEISMNGENVKTLVGNIIPISNKI